MTDQKDDAVEGETFDPVFRARITIDVYLQAKTEAGARAELAEMDLDAIAYEIEQGVFVGGTKKVEEMTLIADDQLDEEMAKIGSDGSFFRM